MKKNEGKTKKIKKTTKVKSVKKSKNSLKSESDETLIDDKKNQVKVDARELKTSTPIEIMTVDENSNVEKPKKKGWWSK